MRVTTPEVSLLSIQNRPNGGKLTGVCKLISPAEWF
jgi:hypothetical protein